MPSRNYVNHDVEHALPPSVFSVFERVTPKGYVGARTNGARKP